MKKQRLDEFLIAKGLTENKQAAFVVVTEGRVLVNGQKAVSPSQMVVKDAKIEVLEEKKYVGRGALKLEAALKNFKIDVSGKVCADIGSATGGFVQVLLEHGAKKVYAIDTAKGKLDLKLRNDKRVIVMESTDVRDLEILPEPIDFITIDVSLISLRNILPHVGRFLDKNGAVIALFKPQYETRDPKILKHGVIKDSKARENLLNDFLKWADENKWRVLGKIESPIRGSEGNIEYLIYAVLS